MITYLTIDGAEVCFNHAVKAVVEEDADVEINTYDDSDCGDSGAWHIGVCIKCHPPEDSTLDEDEDD